MEKIFQSIAKATIYLLVFLVPLFFLPWTSNVLDFNKQGLLLILVFISLISWLASALASNKLEINLSFLSVPVLLLLLILGVSTIFSLSPYGSFWGWPLVIFSGLLSFLGFILFYFLISNVFKKEEIPFLFLTLFLSGFLVALFFISQFFGKFIFPFDFTQIISFNTIGTLNSLAIYLSLLLILVLASWVFVKKFFKIIFGIFSLVFLAALFLINFQIAWLVFLTGTAILLVFSYVNLQRVGTIFTSLIMAFLVIAIFLTFFRFSLPGLPVPPLEVAPSQRASLEIFQKLPLKDLILGTGPGTFAFNWSKYKTPDINQTIFWATRFNQAGSEILDRAITTGILGILTFFFLIALSLKLGFTSLLKNKVSLESASEDSSNAFDLKQSLGLAIFAGLGSLVVAFFSYPVNFSLFLIFWFLLGCLSVLEEKPRRTWALSASPKQALGFSFLFVLILVSAIGFSIIYFQKYFAEVKYTQGLRAWQGQDNAAAINNVIQAAAFSPQNDLYWRDLSQLYLVRLNEILLQADLTQEERNNLAQPLIVNAINSANQASILSPHDAANWIIRGFVYRNMIGIVGGAEEWAMRAYQSALELEPLSPHIYNEIGLTYLARADMLERQEVQEGREENFRLARENFDKAISLKPDYAPGHFQIAMIYAREGKIPEAIERLEATKQVALFDIGLAFQLGLLYYNDNQLGQAKAEFERAIAIDENFSNARYFLGLIYDREGNREGAIEEFERIEKLNPGHEEVRRILSNLRQGKPALEGVVPGQPPIQEGLPEQLER